MAIDQRDEVDGGVSRRQVMRWCAVGAGAGLAAWSSSGAAATAAGVMTSQRGGGSVAAPPVSIIRTVLGDIDPSAISGAVLMHEHLSNGPTEPRDVEAGTTATEPTRDAGWMLEELKAARQAGVGCIVGAQASLTGAAMFAFLERMAKGTGLHLVTTGAYYTSQYYGRELGPKSEDEITDGLVTAAATGRYGAFGEFGMLNDEADLDAVERKAFRAVARAQVRTNLPIFTHTNYSTGANVSMDAGVRQLDVLEAAGARPAAVAIGHVCCLDDPMVSVASRIAKRGAFVAFDRVTRQQQWVSDDKKARMVVALLEAGLGDHLLLSSDYIGRVNTTTGEIMGPGPMHARDGGPGYARTLLLFVPLLRKMGVDDKSIQRLTVDNPRRFLSFAPRQA